MKAARPVNEINAALKKCGTYFAFCFMFSAAINILFLVPPLYMLQVYNRVLSSGSEATLLMLTMAVLMGLLAMMALDIVRSRILIRAGIRIDKLLSTRVLEALVERGVYPGTWQHGQALRDLDVFRQFITGQGIHALFDAPWMPLYLVVTFALHPVLGLVALVGALLLIALAVANEYATRKGLLKANEAAIRNYSDTEATLRNSEVIQAMGMLKGLSKQWQQDRRMVMSHQALSSDRGASFSASIRFVRLFLQSFMLGTGAWLVIERLITPGAMFAATILLGRALAPIEQVVSASRTFVAARESFQRVRDLLQTTPKRELNQTLPVPTGALTAERLVFGPPGADKPVIKGISFAIKAGESVGIIGPSAAGKSTLARLLMGVWKPHAGNVRLDAADVYAWNRDDFGKHVGYLPQDIELFAGTIRDNISRFTDAPSEMVIEAARRAAVHDMVLRLPKGYETVIAEGGATLSGGQKQRIALARALFGNPKLLVLDEPNSNLDTEGEQALSAALTELKALGSTIIIIAHRPSILSTVDRLMVLRDGTVEMFGPRNEVMAKLTPNVVRPAAFAGGGGSLTPRES